MFKHDKTPHIIKKKKVPFSIHEHSSCTGELPSFVTGSSANNLGSVSSALHRIAVSHACYMTIERSNPPFSNFTGCMTSVYLEVSLEEHGF